MTRAPLCRRRYTDSPCRRFRRCRMAAMHVRAWKRSACTSGGLIADADHRRTGQHSPAARPGRDRHARASAGALAAWTAAPAPHAIAGRVPRCIRGGGDPGRRCRAASDVASSAAADFAPYGVTPGVIEPRRAPQPTRGGESTTRRQRRLRVTTSLICRERRPDRSRRRRYSRPPLAFGRRLGLLGAHRLLSRHLTPPLAPCR